MTALPPVTFETYSITSGIELPDARLHLNTGIHGSFKSVGDLARLSTFMKNTPRHMIEEIAIHFTLEDYEDYDSYIVFIPTRNLGSSYIYFICDHIEIPRELLGWHGDEVDDLLDQFKIHVIASLERFFYDNDYPDLVENLVRHMRIKGQTYDDMCRISPHINDEVN